MEYRPLGKTGLTISAMGMGGGTFGREIDQDLSFQVMDHAFDRGITLFDTAEAYGAGASEEAVGNWLKTRNRRNDIVLATKVAGELTAEWVLASAEESLKRLQVDSVDLFQAHNWSENVPLEETLGALQHLVEQGKTRFVGCSNFTGEQLQQSLDLGESHGWTRLESVQPNYNLVTREIETDLLPLCDGEQIGVVTYSPLGAGFLTGKYREGHPPPSGTRFDVIPGHQDVYYSDTNFQAVETLRSLSEETGRSMVGLALAWVLSRSGTTCTLIGARSLDHIDQAFEAQSIGLTPELDDRLGSLVQE